VTIERYYELMGEIVAELGEIVAELGRLRVAVEVLAGAELDRREVAGPVPFDQGDEYE
jgi:hypothetical protein